MVILKPKLLVDLVDNLKFSVFNFELNEVVLIVLTGFGSGAG